MSKPFRIIISGFSLLFAGLSFWWIPPLLSYVLIGKFNSLAMLSIALYPFWVLLLLFCFYSFYKIIKGDSGFFFIFLNSLGFFELAGYLFLIFAFSR